MKLIYYKKHANFGDALNPMVFNRFLPGFFNRNEESVFIGIGSILHMKFPDARQKIVFSSGYAYYGDMPRLDSSYYFSCVRGPLTCSALKIDKKYSITDGAALLKRFHFVEEKKKHAFSFMPHHESTSNYDWKTVCDHAGFHYIDPGEDPMKIIADIKASEVVIAEGMHAAIVADTLRVPWIPVKCYGTINEFKWKDWTSSLELKYRPQRFRPLFKRPVVRQKIKERIPRLSSGGNASLSKVYSSYQDWFREKKTLRGFSDLRSARTFLSAEDILESRVQQLEEQLEIVSSKFSYQV